MYNRKQFLWLLVGCYSYYCPNCFTFCLKNKNKRQKWGGVWPWPWTYHPGMFVLAPHMSNMAAINFSPVVKWHFARMPPLVSIWSLWSWSGKFNFFYTITDTIDQLLPHLDFITFSSSSNWFLAIFRKSVCWMLIWSSFMISICEENERIRS